MVCRGDRAVEGVDGVFRAGEGGCEGGGCEVGVLVAEDGGGGEVMGEWGGEREGDREEGGR